VRRARSTLPLALGALLALVGTAGAELRTDPPETTRFVVLGHVRGDANGLSPKLTELLREVRALDPRFAVLTGDIIWGDVQSDLADSAVVERQWNEIDSALATLGIPIYRVPGNHDISDLPSRNIWWRRYGPLPNEVEVDGVRLLLLSSAWIPADSDRRHNPYIRGVDLDSSQVAWLATRLGQRSDRPTFAFTHHLLWWEPDDGRWWREVHPLLAAAGVEAVFSGDYGPLKFSTMERDGVRYYQSSMELPVSLPILQNRVSSRVLSAQFDSFFEVEVDRGGAARVRVHTFAEESSGEFTPARYRAITEVPPPPPRPLLDRVWELIGSPKRLVALGAGLALVFGAGWWIGRRSAHGRASV